MSGKGQHNHFNKFPSHSSKMKFNTKLFENPSAVKTNAEDSSYRVEVYQSHMSSSFEKNAIGKINISPEKAEEIEKIISEIPLLPRVAYEDMKTSQFKALFLDKRSGDFEQHMDFFIENMERNPAIDHELFMENNKKIEDQKFMEMYNKRKCLPAFSKKNQILKLIEDNQIVLISGDTGCGKTTQIAQFILDEYIMSYKGSVCKIVCTQPRRISATSVAERVASERAESLGCSCGYQIRMEKQLPRKYGSILFVTTGIIIRVMENDPTLNNISHLILDEIHERDINSDLMLSLVKILINKRKDLKVILMSATLNEKRFKEFFDYCPQIVIEGLTHHVEEYFLEDVVDRLNYVFSPRMHQAETRQYNSLTFLQKVLPYVKGLEEQRRFSHKVCEELMKPSSEDLNTELIYRLTMDICKNEEEGAILIFIMGYDDIENLMDLFSNLPKEEYVLVALHSLIPIDEQRLAFEKPPPGVRKIIIATNIAETSITIDDVIYVIDSGWAKMKAYDAVTKTENLEPRFISRANAIQRKGRAGRLRAGKCFRLYTKGRYEALVDFQPPEILRIRLENLILQTKLLRLGKVLQFFDKLLDRPDTMVVDYSLSLLSQLGALDEEESLTPLGYYLAKLPISPQLGKMLLLGVFFKCLDPILNVAVALDYKSPFIPNTKNIQNNQLLQFSEGVKSDHLLLHKAFVVYQRVENNSRREFCKQFGLNMETLKTMNKLKQEFMDNLIQLALVATNNSRTRAYNLYSNNIEMIKSIVCAGLYPNIIIACPAVPRMLFRTVDGKKVQLHPKSVLARDRFFSCPLLAYYIKLKTKIDMVHDATVCSPFPIIFFADTFRIEKTMHSNYIIANNMKFKCDKSVSTLIESLRDRLDQFLLYCLINPTPIELKNEEKEEKFLKIMVDLLASPEA
ncbi:hypothetical protein WA026_000343 [Henosepilachna vigintioctopunctata]|uniref:RNA helicase n=1 Tax=Henosepilachna vigintioctopunctata TaxID=420089 RepID=A0AAW1UZ04_9CUCU